MLKLPPHWRPNLNTVIFVLSALGIGGMDISGGRSADSERAALFRSFHQLEAKIDSLTATENQMQQQIVRLTQRLDDETGRFSGSPTAFIPMGSSATVAPAVAKAPGP